MKVLPYFLVHNTPRKLKVTRPATPYETLLFFQLRLIIIQVLEVPGDVWEVEWFDLTHACHESEPQHEGFQGSTNELERRIAMQAGSAIKLGFMKIDAENIGLKGRGVIDR